MKDKPWTFDLLAICLCLLGLAVPFQVINTYNHPFYEINLIFSHINIINWVTMVICFTNAILSFKASRWIILTMPISLLLVATNNWFASWLVIDDTTPQISLITTVVFILVNAALFIPRSWACLKDPHKRWWQNKPRYKHKINVIMTQENSSLHLLAQTFDISETGMFLKTPNPEQFSMGDKVELELKLSDKISLKCHGEIRRISLEQNSYPLGYGVSFIDLSFQEKRLLKSYLDAYMLSQEHYSKAA